MRTGLFIVILAGVVVFAPIGYVGTDYLKTRESECWIQVNKQTHASLKAGKEEFIEMVTGPAYVLAQMLRYPWMKEFLAAHAKGESDAGELGDRAAENLLALYPDLGNAVRVAILDTAGKEIIALEWTDVEPRRIKDAELVDRGDETWVGEVVGGSRSRHATEVYRRPVPEGRGYIPYVTMAQALKTATEVMAIACVEVDLTPWFDRMKKRGERTKVYVVDDGQRYLIHPDRASYAFAFEKGRTITLSEDFGEAADRMTEYGNMAWPKDRPDRVVVWDAIPYGGGKGPGLELILSVSVDEAVAGVEAQKRRFTRVLIVSFVVFAVASILLFRWLVGGPVGEARRSARMLREGKRLEGPSGSILSVTRELSAELRLLSDEMATRAREEERSG